MKISPMLLRRYLVASFLVPFVGAPITAHGALDDVVFLRGKISDGKELPMIYWEGATVGTPTISPQKVCQNAQDFIIDNMLDFEGELKTSVEFDIFYAENKDFKEAVGDSLASLVDCANSYSIPGDMLLIYTTCAMIMRSGTYWMRLTVPPLTSEPTMDILDMSSNTGVSVALETTLDQLAEANLAGGDLQKWNLTGPAGTRSVTLRVWDGGGFDVRQYTAHRYNFDYEVRLGTFFQGQGPAVAFGQSAVIDTTGHAWIAPDAPGADVISVFYSNFNDNIVPSAGSDSLMGGAVRLMAGLASHGIPVETTQTNTMKVMAGIISMGTGQDSTSEINTIAVVPSSASHYCGPTVIPDGMEMTDLDAAITAATAGIGSATDAPQGLSQPMSGATSNLTPEEQAALQGLGASLGQILGGILSGQALPGGAAALGGAVEPAVADSRPPSADLYSDDLTQMVQNHLQALGYEPGNTDGELNTQTMIAISQFQAEKGLLVTGEVSPQLAGILSAEVDR